MDVNDLTTIIKDSSIPLVIKTINHLTRLHIVHSTTSWLSMPFHFINLAKWCQFLPLCSFCWHGYPWPMAKFGYKLPKIKTLIKNMHWSIIKTLIRDMNWSIFDIILLNVNFYHSKSFMISLFTISTIFNKTVIGFYEYCFRIYIRVNGCQLPHKLGTL
jgi:hypothetical protein